FDSRVGGYFRVSLSHPVSDDAGITSEHLETFHGQFVELIPDRKLVMKLELETPRVELQGEMTITIELKDADGGTEVEIFHDDLPPGIVIEENVAGWEVSLDRLAEDRKSVE